MDILIRTVTELAGAEKAAQALEQQIGAAKATGKAYDELEEKLAKAKLAIAQFKNNPPPLDPEPIEKTNHHLEGLHRLFHSLNEVVPGAGALMQAAFSPVGAAISLAVMALRLFQEKLKEVNVEFDRLEENAAKPLTHRLEAIREGVISGAVAFDALNARLEEASRREQTIKEKTDEALQVMHRQFSEAQTLGEATIRNELARLDAAHTMGIVGEAEYARRKLAIQIQAEENKRKLQEDAAAAEIALKKKQIEEAKGELPELHKQTLESQAAQLHAIRETQAFGSMEDYTRHKEEAEKEYKDWLKQSHTADRTAAADILSSLPQRASFDEQRVAVRGSGKVSFFSDKELEDWNRLHAAVVSTTSEFKAAPEEIAKRKTAEAGATREAERAEKREEDRRGFITDEGREVKRKQDEADAQKAIDAQLNQLARQGQQAENTAHGSMAGAVVQDRSVAAAVAADQRVSPQAAANLIDHERLITGLELTLQAAARLMRDQTSTIEGFKRTVKELQDRIDGMDTGHH